MQQASFLGLNLFPLVGVFVLRLFISPAAWLTSCRPAWLAAWNWSGAADLPAQPLPCSLPFAVTRQRPGCVWGCSSRCRCLCRPHWHPAQCTFPPDLTPASSLFGSSTAEDWPDPQRSLLTPLQENLSRKKGAKSIAQCWRVEHCSL